MPELPEVEILVRQLRPLLAGKTIRGITVKRARVLCGIPEAVFRDAVSGARFAGLTRRGKYLVFALDPRAPTAGPVTLVGHLGMTGRMYTLPHDVPLPKHTSLSFDLGMESFVFEDMRGFGKAVLDESVLTDLGPEPLDVEFTARYLGKSLKKCRQPIKVKLLDQSLVAGIGNIYASEALFRARIAPWRPAQELTDVELRRVRKAVREVLREAIEFGERLILAFEGTGTRDGLFYFGSAADTEQAAAERFRVYDRAGQPCLRCGENIKRTVQAARSSYYCPGCQPDK